VSDLDLSIKKWQSKLYAPEGILLEAVNCNVTFHSGVRSKYWTERQMDRL